jgi:hypothetical protein
MHSQSIELRGHSRRGTPLVMLLACLGALAGCAGSHQAPATASSEPEPNSVLEKDRQMAFSRESPAPTPEHPAAPPTAAGSPGVSGTVQPTRAESHTPVVSENAAQPAVIEQPPPADPATAKQDQKVIDHTAATSERLANQTAAHTKNARDRTAVPAGTPKAADKAADNKSADNKPSQPSARRDLDAARPIERTGRPRPHGEGSTCSHGR